MYTEKTKVYWQKDKTWDYTNIQESNLQEKRIHIMGNLMQQYQSIEKISNVMRKDLWYKNPAHGTIDGIWSSKNKIK